MTHSQSSDAEERTQLDKTSHEGRDGQTKTMRTCLKPADRVNRTVMDDPKGAKKLQLVGNKGSLEATPESHGVPWWAARLMECHDDRKRRARESNVALQDLEKAMSRCKRRDGDGQLP